LSLLEASLIQTISACAVESLRPSTLNTSRAQTEQLAK
jgi:hypothetical protein